MKTATRGRRPPKAARTRAGLEGSVEAKRAAALVLEGLSGLRSPVEAARALGVSPPRYYALELRGLQGLISAMEPAKRGRRRGVEQELAEAVRDRDRLRRELSRAQALLRSAQRAMGILPGPDGKPGRTKSCDGKPRRRRRPTARAKKAVRVLRRAVEAAGSAGVEMSRQQQSAAPAEPS